MERKVKEGVKRVKNKTAASILLVKQIVQADATSRKKRRGRVAAVTDVLNGKEKQVKKELLRLEEKNV